MSCPRERDLALFVEDDLPVSEVAALQAHVLECAVCRNFLLSLEASQQALKELATQPIADEALAVLRSRATAIQAASRRDVQWRWALTAAVIAALLPGAYLALSRLRTHETRRVQAASAPPLMPVTRAAGQETQAVVTPPAPVRRATRAAVPVAASGLSTEEADQLARAVVAVSRIKALRDLEARPASPPEAPLVRVATDDPNVVIYWRLEPSGGK